jgi:hypothetical protein
VFQIYIIIAMEQESHDIRDLVERETKVPKLQKKSPIRYFRNETCIRSPLMTYDVEEVRQREVGDNL